MKEKKTRILFILPALISGGGEHVTLTIIRNLDKSLFIPILLVFKRKGQLVYGIQDSVDLFSIDSGSWIERMSTLIRVFKTSDIIVGVLPHLPLYCAAIGTMFFKKKSFGWVHSMWDHVENRYSPMKNFLHWIFVETTYRLLESVIFVSKGAMDSFLLRHPSLRKKVTYIYNPISIERIRKLSEVDIPEAFTDRPVIVYVGRLEKVKQIDIIIKAHHLLLKRGVKNSVLIIGEGPQRESIQELISELEVRETCRLLGHKKNPYPYIKSADFLVLASESEGFSIVLCEAMALGVPVISTPCGGPKEILDNGTYGIICDGFCPEKIADAIENVYRNKSLYSSLKDSGEKRAEFFSVNRIIKIFEEKFYLQKG